jgi:hypothetical protein
LQGKKNAFVNNRVVQFYFVRTLAELLLMGWGIHEWMIPVMVLIALGVVYMRALDRW